MTAPQNSPRKPSPRARAFPVASAWDRFSRFGIQLIATALVAVPWLASAEATIKSKVVERVGPGGVFGEMALVDQSPRAASAITDGNCSLLAINRNDLLALVKAKPAFAVSLLKAVAERLRRMT